MNKYLKTFLQRGLVFGSGGPIITGIIFAILGATLEGFSLSGGQVCLAIFSTYLLAFVHAGASVFNQIEHWPVSKSLLCHFGSLYVAYTLCYIANSWIAFDPLVILTFTGIFTLTYFAVWGIVVLSIKSTEKRLNKRLSAERKSDE